MKDIKKVAESYDATITNFVTAVMIKSIMTNSAEGNIKGAFSENTLNHAILYIPSGKWKDAVYSSEESYGEYFSHAYPEAVHRLVDVKRIHYPISGTAIRNMESEEQRAEWMIQ